MRISHAAAAASLTLRAVRLALCLVAASLALGGAPAHAQGDAFSARVAVADRSDAERGAAYAEALRRVLLDNAADRTLMNRDDVRAALRSADAYVETFRFDVPEPGSGILPGTPVTDAVRRSGEAVGLLLVRFDRDRVLALVDGSRDPGASIGAAPGDGGAAGLDPSALSPGEAERAFADVGSVLVWLLVEDGERTVAGSEPAALKVRERLREIAGGAGVTVAFGDAEGLDAEALRALDAPAIQAASLRYATDAVLVGRLSRGIDGAAGPLGGPAEVPGPDAGAGVGPGAAGGAGIDLRGRLPAPPAAPRVGPSGWRGEWLKAVLPGGPAGEGAVDEVADEALPDEAPGSRAGVALRTVTASARLDDALRDGLGWLLPGLASGAGARYAYGGGGDATEGLVWVGSLDSLDAYARVMALFESVGGVDSVYPRTLADGAGVFAVRPRRALESIAAAAAGTGWLRRGAPPETLDAVNGDGSDAGTGRDAFGRDAFGAAGAAGADRRRGGAGRPARPARETFAGLARQTDLAFDVVF